MLPTLTLCLTALTPAGPPAAPPAAVREGGLAATVRVTDAAGGGVGTGVVVGVRDGSVYVLTAAHVLGPGRGPRVETFGPRAPRKPDSVHDLCELLFRATDSDLAVVRLPAGKREWATAPVAPPPPAGKVPDAGWARRVRRGPGPRVEAVALTGRKLVRRKDGSAGVLLAGPRGGGRGRSGGPLLDGDGRLLGVCNGTQDGMTYYAHPDEIRAALRAHRLGWAAGDTADK